MGEGLSAVEVGKELGEHARHGGEHDRGHRHEQLISITEAAVLSVVTIMAAWSGFSAAKWSTESSLDLAKASATRSIANRDYQEALTLRVADSTTFNAWFGAYIGGHKQAALVAQRRFRPAYEVAFNAWMATHPFTNPHAPAGPAYMPQYKLVGDEESAKLDAAAEANYAEGQKAAEHADDYIRTTVILASVLFLVGISSHFRLKAVRMGLISVGVALLLVAIVAIASLPGPP